MAKLERDHLEADLATVRSLLNGRNREMDPIGWAHFTARADELERRLSALRDELETTASVALFFGGRPVVGSRGIQADFGGKALEEFQHAISTQLAALQGAVGTRGPIPHRARGQMLITDIARGSLGFVLEEAQPEGGLVDTQLKLAVDGIVDLIHRISSPDEEAFEVVTESVDNRVLGSVRSFLKLMDEAGATLRIVEGERDFSLQRDAIEIARRRVDELEIYEESITESGILYLLPDSRRFELHRADGSVLRGMLSSEVSDYLLPNGRPLPGIIGSLVTIGLARRSITSRGREPRFSYRFISVVDPEEAPSLALEL